MVDVPLRGSNTASVLRRFSVGYVGYGAVDHHIAWAYIECGDGASGRLGGDVGYVAYPPEIHDQARSGFMLTRVALKLKRYPINQLGIVLNRSLGQ